MKPLLAILVLLLPVSVFVAGCGSGSRGTASGPQTKEQAQQQLEQMKKGLSAQLDSAKATGNIPQKK